MDFILQDIIFTSDSVEKAVADIIDIKCSDGITYKLIKISDIMKESKYEGYQISLVGILENIRIPFSIDIAFGDPITPKNIEYNYQSIVIDKNISIQAYNIETVLAEKLQTIIDKQIGNSRMKDFFDIYILNKLRSKQINLNTLNEAINNTFQYRNTIFNKPDKRLIRRNET
jgi:predicted nucleotidyltransferase component of viral defense system